MNKFTFDLQRFESEQLYIIQKNNRLYTSTSENGTNSDTELTTTTENNATHYTIESGNYTIEQDIQLDHPIWVTGTATITVNENCTLSKTSNNNNYEDHTIAVNRGGDLTLNGKGTILDNQWVAVKMTVYGEATTATTDNEIAKLTVDNNLIIKGYYYGISGNGTRHGTEITINGGTIIATADKNNTAIYHPQEGTLNIKGGTITGYSSAVEIRSGELNITGGTFTATAEDYSCVSNNNGTTTKGAGIAIAQHTTNKQITVNISGTNTQVEGAVAVSVANPQKNTSNAPVVNLNGGTFKGTTEGAIQVDDNDYSFASGNNSDTRVVVNIGSTAVFKGKLYQKFNGTEQYYEKGSVGAYNIENGATFSESYYVPDGYIYTESTLGCIVSGTNDVAVIVDTNGEEHYYQKLGEAISAAATGTSGTKVRLLKDITLTSTISVSNNASDSFELDLQGHNIEAGNGVSQIFNIEYGNFTLSNTTTGTTKGVISSEYGDASSAMISIGSGASFEMKGGTVKNTSTNSNSVIVSAAGTSFKMTGGKLEGTYTALDLKNGTGEITGNAEISVTNAAGSNTNAYGIKMSDSVTSLKIGNGTDTPKITASTSQSGGKSYAVYADGTNPPAVTVSSGILNGGTGVMVNKGSLTVTGGTVEGTVDYGIHKASTASDVIIVEKDNTKAPTVITGTTAPLASDTATKPFTLTYTEGSGSPSYTAQDVEFNNVKLSTGYIAETQGSPNSYAVAEPTLEKADQDTYSASTKWKYTYSGDDGYATTITFQGNLFNTDTLDNVSIKVTKNGNDNYTVTIGLKDGTTASEVFNESTTENTSLKITAINDSTTDLGKYTLAKDTALTDVVGYSEAKTFDYGTYTFHDAGAESAGYSLADQTLYHYKKATNVFSFNQDGIKFDTGEEIGNYITVEDSIVKINNAAFNNTAQANGASLFIKDSNYSLSIGELTKAAGYSATATFNPNTKEYKSAGAETPGFDALGSSAIVYRGTPEKFTLSTNMEFDGDFYESELTVSGDSTNRTVTINDGFLINTQVANTKLSIVQVGGKTYSLSYGGTSVASGYQSQATWDKTNLSFKGEGADTAGFSVADNTLYYRRLADKVGFNSTGGLTFDDNEEKIEDYITISGKTVTISQSAFDGDGSKTPTANSYLSIAEGYSGYSFAIDSSTMSKAVGYQSQATFTNDTKTYKSEGADTAGYSIADNNLYYRGVATTVQFGGSVAFIGNAAASLITVTDNTVQVGSGALSADTQKEGYELSILTGGFTFKRNFGAIKMASDYSSVATYSNYTYTGAGATKEGFYQVGSLSKLVYHEKTKDKFRFQTDGIDFNSGFNVGNISLAETAGSSTKTVSFIGNALSSIQKENGSLSIVDLITNDNISYKFSVEGLSVASGYQSQASFDVNTKHYHGTGATSAGYSLAENATKMYYYGLAQTVSLSGDIKFAAGASTNVDNLFAVYKDSSGSTVFEIKSDSAFEGATQMNGASLYIDAPNSKIRYLGTTTTWDEANFIVADKKYNLAGTREKGFYVKNKDTTNGWLTYSASAASSFTFGGSVGFNAAATSGASVGDFSINGNIVTINRMEALNSGTFKDGYELYINGNNYSLSIGSLSNAGTYNENASFSAANFTYKGRGATDQDGFVVGTTSGGLSSLTYRLKAEGFSFTGDIAFDTSLSTAKLAEYFTFTDGTGTDAGKKTVTINNAAALSSAQNANASLAISTEDANKYVLGLGQLTRAEGYSSANKFDVSIRTYQSEGALSAGYELTESTLYYRKQADDIFQFNDEITFNSTASAGAFSIAHNGTNKIVSIIDANALNSNQIDGNTLKITLNGYSLAIGNLSSARNYTANASFSIEDRKYQGIGAESTGYIQNDDGSLTYRKKADHIFEFGGSLAFAAAASTAVDTAFYINNKIITINQTALKDMTQTAGTSLYIKEATGGYSVSDYTLALGDGIDTEGTKFDEWTLQGNKAAYMTNRSGSHYELQDSAKALHYVGISGGTSKVELNGIADLNALSYADNVVNIIAWGSLNSASGIAVVSNSGAYSFSLSGAFNGASFAGLSTADTITNIGSSIAIYGFSGADNITNSGSNVSIFGGEDDDTITNSDGSNISIDGGKGNDIINLTKGTNVTVNVSEGNDTIDVTGFTGGFSVASFSVGDFIKGSFTGNLSAVNGGVSIGGITISGLSLSESQNGLSYATGSFSFLGWNSAGAYTVDGGISYRDTTNKATLFTITGLSNVIGNLSLSSNGVDIMAGDSVVANISGSVVTLTEYAFTGLSDGSIITLTDDYTEDGINYGLSLGNLTEYNTAGYSAVFTKTRREAPEFIRGEVRRKILS